MFSARNLLWTLFFATVSALTAIVLIGDGSDSAASNGVILSADPSTVIVKLAPSLAGFPKIVPANERDNLHHSSQMQSGTSAELALQMYQATGNTRFLGVAKSAITPWLKTERPPKDIWLLRARVLQIEHHFAEAAQDFSRYNNAYSASTEALLLEADAWRRGGEIARARRTCLALAFVGRTDLATFCSAEILLTLGQHERAITVIEPLIDATASLPSSQKNWALAIYADILSATGEPGQSAAVWASIMSSGDAPLAYKLAYADALLAVHAYPSVVDLLSEDTGSTAALIRLCFAATRLYQDSAVALRAELERRLSRSTSAEDADLHLREEALYALWLEDDTEEALRLSLRNWELQKGWEDTALVLHVANLLQRSAPQQRVDAWQRSNAMRESI